MQIYAEMRQAAAFCDTANQKLQYKYQIRRSYDRLRFKAFPVRQVLSRTGKKTDRHNDATRQGSGDGSAGISSAAPYIARLHAILVLETFGEI